MFKTINILMSVLLITGSLGMDSFIGTIYNYATNKELSTHLRNLNKEDEKKLGDVYNALYGENPLENITARATKLESLEDDQKSKIFSAAEIVIQYFFSKARFEFGTESLEKCVKIGNLLKKDNENLPRFISEIITAAQKSIEERGVLLKKLTEVNAPIPRGSLQLLLH